MGEGEREWVVNGLEFSSRGSEVCVWGTKKNAVSRGGERECRLLLMYVHLDELDYFRDDSVDAQQSSCDGAGEGDGDGEGEGEEVTVKDQRIL